MKFEFSRNEFRFSFELLDVATENDTATLCFAWYAQSKGFCFEIDNLWFHKDDVATFLKNANDLLSRRSESTSLHAMSGFEISIKDIEGRGRYSLRFAAETFSPDNKSAITLILETQELHDFLYSLSRTILQSPA